ncbi:16S rRNA (adenine(1518)-N(6)/adenine(1519)-N(6))-dimethyltransferase RsmA [Marinicella gelatinilytica]|uniref:16S rRNA (adenine(1518)-N(6)/adenine(1519)-N(6))- dimethyltransferase RsmA n=1 Tax=Marinicella gelatinilytica TaxID=2996017 RepID=UPI002260D475|nr:16S rRNA (adenine(1518)-N(6)/adenine(1519)-N(6))-dimethyltransferase RsmA [Marinicella gelatinilytica]MCX7545696.1 16S rRNA (adenine(1518)-N(6)/adenine(1519)-N(6))-dimethyltransferase RsmA [Marinicella gelatinilytica]
MRAKKRLGQNFLQDAAIIAQIIQLIRPEQSQQIIEIGPGTGALTDHLAEVGVPLSLIEFDQDLIAPLQQRFRQHKHVTIYHQDALQLKLNQGSYLVVGNLPYNISSPLLINLLKQSNHIQRGVFMLQKELVQRICAPPGVKAFGRLSVMLQHRFDCYAALTVPPEAFKPVPKVDSQIIELIPKINPTEVDITSLEFIVKQAFAQRRKTIRNNLKKWFSDDELQSFHIDPQQRPETLLVTQYEQLAQQYHAHH